MSGLIQFHNVYRDGIQSLMGTSPSAKEIVAAHKNAHKIGTATIQTGGGTFYDIFAKKGRNEWAEIETILSDFKEKGVRQSALIRGDCLFKYSPQPFDVVLGMVREYGGMGMNILQNFHGLNDTRLTAGVAKAVQIVREEDGHDIEAWGTLCVEDNPNVTIEACLRAAEQLVAQKHTAFYLKSASGRLDPEMGYDLVAALVDEYPDMPIHMHAHATYGEAAAFYMRGIEAAIERNHTIGIDVVHPALAGSTAHPSMFKMHSLIRNHENKAISGAAPALDFGAISADMDSLLEMRFRYRRSEAKYDKDLLEAMRGARAPGGATATLRGIPGLEANLAAVLGTKDWDAIQLAVYQKAAEIQEEFGHPTQVTPYAFITSLYAAQSVIADAHHRPRKQGFAKSYISAYLTGQLGVVPENVDPVLKAHALHVEGLQSELDYTPAEDRVPGLPGAEDKLKALGLNNPTERQKLSAFLLDKGPEHVVACARGKNKPAVAPELPDYARVPTDPDGEFSNTGAARIKVKGPAYIVQALGGIATLELLAQKALFLKQLDDDLNIFPDGQEYKKDEWRNKLVRQIHDFQTSIPRMLAGAGFVEYSSHPPASKSEMALAFARHSTGVKIEKIIRDVMNGKGEGIYEHTKAALEDYRMRQTPSVILTAGSQELS